MTNLNTHNYTVCQPAKKKKKKLTKHNFFVFCLIHCVNEKK